MNNNPESLLKGAKTIGDVVKNLTLSPGVYRMLNKDGDVLYVGKAKHLKKRVVSYTRIEQLPNRLKRMVSETTSMEIVTTHTETEALLLESNLIKKLQPRYNILLKDDKSFPYIKISKDHKFPLIARHRGPKEKGNYYFGPFASSHAVDETIILLQKVFMLRTCSDSEFNNRERPCLKYHIKRCSAPCVKYVSDDEYSQNLLQAISFLKGRNEDVQKYLKERMENASKNLQFEDAAKYRDRIRLLIHIQSKQIINLIGIGDTDVMSIETLGGITCVQIFFFRNGRNHGTESFFLSHTSGYSIEEIFNRFIMQFFIDRAPSNTVLLSIEPNNISEIKSALKEKHGVKTNWEVPQAGVKKEIIDHATINAKQAISRKISQEDSFYKYFKIMKDLFNLSKVPSRVEIYDNSHMQGSYPYGVMVVAKDSGFCKKSYRKFSIKNENACQDDFEMMREVIKRRFKRKNDDGWEVPDLLLIDGGIGQLNAVIESMKELDIKIPAVGIAKGKDRNAGRERFFMEGRDPFKIKEHDPVLHFIQRLRDESHRFAIGTHRAKREKSLTKSVLDQIPGIGGKRKRNLLNHFGSSSGVSKAGIKDLIRVDGINNSVAKTIYNFFHEK